MFFSNCLCPPGSLWQGFWPGSWRRTWPVFLGRRCGVFWSCVWLWRSKRRRRCPWRYYSRRSRGGLPHFCHCSWDLVHLRWPGGRWVLRRPRGGVPGVPHLLQRRQLWSLQVLVPLPQRHLVPAAILRLRLVVQRGLLHHRGLLRVERWDRSWETGKSPVFEPFVNSRTFSIF